MTGDQPGTVVWTRQYDEAAHRNNMNRFYKFYAAPSAVAIMLLAVLVGVGEALGLLILLGLLGAMIFFAVWLTGRNKRTNPTITRIGNDLHWAKRTVNIDQVKAFTTFIDIASMSVNHQTRPGGQTVSAEIGKARFLLVDDSEVDFAWAHLEKSQLNDLRAALEDVLPGRWVPIESLRAPL